MLQQDQEIFNILLEAVSDGVLIVDNHQHIMEVNKTAEVLFGYKKSELIERGLNLNFPRVSIVPRSNGCPCLTTV